MPNVGLILYNKTLVDAVSCGDEPRCVDSGTLFTIFNLLHSRFEITHDLIAVAYPFKIRQLANSALAPFIHKT